MLIALIALAALSIAAPVSAASLKPPVADGIWVRPAGDEACEPTIGFRDGLRISLWPTEGPRGLIRICAPYVLQDSKFPLLNFIAVEPIVGGRRSYSEMEKSADGKPGKRMWFSDCLKSGLSGATHDTRGIPGTLKSGGKTVRTLAIVVNVEKLDNGARPQVQVVFREDRPDEVGFRVYAAPDSAEMDACVLSATMGNYSRTRLLYLKDDVADSRELWPDHRGDGFTEHMEYALERLFRAADGSVTAFITPSESSLKDAVMPRGGWAFDGKVATQYWRKYPGKPSGDLKVRVNGRTKYWATQADIPGGVSFENFEMVEPFRKGGELWFGVSLRTPRELGWRGKPDGPAQ